MALTLAVTSEGINEKVETAKQKEEKLVNLKQRLQDVKKNEKILRRYYNDTLDDTYRLVDLSQGKAGATSVLRSDEHFAAANAFKRAYYKGGADHQRTYPWISDDTRFPKSRKSSTSNFRAPSRSPPSASGRGPNPFLRTHPIGTNSISRESSIWWVRTIATAMIGQSSGACPGRNLGPNPTSCTCGKCTGHRFPHFPASGSECWQMDGAVASRFRTPSSGKAGQAHSSVVYTSTINPATSRSWRKKMIELELRSRQQNGRK